MRFALFFYLILCAIAAEPCKPSWRAISMKSEFKGEDQRWYRAVKYLRTEAERAPYLARIEDGAFIGANGKPLHTRWHWSQWAAPQDWITTIIHHVFHDKPPTPKVNLVLSTDGKLYVGPLQVGYFHHSSFMAGEKVLFAGEARFENGKLVELSNRSGHYLTPKWTFDEFYRWLEKSGVDLSAVEIMDASAP